MWISYLVIFVTLAFYAVYGLVWFLVKPTQYKRRVNDDLSKFFKDLLYYYKRGFLVIEAPNKHRFIQFRIYMRDGKTGIEFGFPLAPWSEKYYERLKTVLYDQGIDHEFQPTGEDIVVSFIMVDFDQDWAKAMEFARMVLLEVFGMRPGDRIRVSLNDLWD